MKPHDRNAMGAIEKAIRDSDLGMNPPTMPGHTPRVPAAHEERRKEYVKVVKHHAGTGGSRSVCSA